jgi:hypothetical protein
MMLFNLQKESRKLIQFLIVLFSLANICVIVSMVGENSDCSAVIFAKNNDAAEVIKVAVRTSWTRDNGWRPYGPVYYRLAHSLAQIVPYYRGDSLIHQEQVETNHHLALMLVSFISLILTCYVVSGFFGLHWTERVGVTSVLLSSFLLSRSFARYVLVAHPDLLLSLFTALLFLTSYRFLKDPKTKTLSCIGIAFGLMLATKLTAILFLPGVFFVLLRRGGVWANLFCFLNFSVGAAGTYFLVGYPQSFDVQGVLKFMDYYSQFSSFADRAAVVEWLRLFSYQAGLPLALILGLILVGNRNEIAEGTKKITGRFLSLKLFLLAFCPFLVLLSRKFTSPHDYYTIPFVIMILLSATALFKRRIPPIPKLVARTLRPVLLLLLIPTIGFRAHSHFASLVREETACRMGHQEIRAWISDRVWEGHTILLTPYVPHPYELDGLVIKWAYSFDLLKDVKYSALAFNKTMYDRYLGNGEPSDYVKVDYKDWGPIREFFNHFKDGKDVRTPDGREWHMVKDKCDIQLWLVKSQ